MSNTTSIVDVIQHYQKSIDISQDNEPRLLHCINKLYKLPIKVEHLQKTGVGKTVNSLRKFNGEIGVAAKTLVTKWKAMVAAEEESNEPMPSNKDTEITEGNDGSNDGSNGQNQMHDENIQRHGTNDSRELYKQNKLNKDHHNQKNNRKGSSPSEAAACVTTTTSYQQDSKESEKRSKSNDLSKHGEIEKVKHHRHRESADSTSHQNSNKRINSSNSNSSSYHKDGERRHKENSDKSKSKHHSHRHRSSNEKEDVSKKDKSDINKLEHMEQHKRHRKTEHETNDNEFKSPPAKKVKVSSSESSKQSKIGRLEDDDDKEDDGFDSSMGANFADVLGMLNVPKKKSKKTSKSSPTVTSSQDVINKDATTTTPKQKVNHQAVNGNSLLAGANVNVGVRSNVNSRTPIAAMSLSNNSKPLTAKPEMLAPTAKLEPLDPNIALELPTISTNYKPMPLNPTVMDCVFNTNTSNSTRPARTLSDAEALNHGISSKTIRTKVYSGVRTGQIYQVSSLFDLCIRFLQKNIDALEYTGGVPYDVLQPVLKKATPQQLFTFEDYNPYLMEDTDSLWQIHVSRNYRTQKRLENETWREMFLRCQEEEERKLNYLADSIKQSQKIAAAPIRKTQLAFLDTMVKPPRNIQRKQEQYGTKSKLVATPAARVASLSAIAPNAAKLGDVRLKVNAANRDNAQISSTTSSGITTTNTSRPKKAPLMQKTLQFIRGRLKR